MRSKHPALLAISFCTVAFTAAAQMTESTTTANAPIHIRVTRPANPQVLPPTLFGSFLEPIGHSTYGGLWADVVENPSFENNMWSADNASTMLKERPELRRASELGLPMPWEPLDPGQGNRYAPERMDAANSYQSLLLMALPEKEVGIKQRVYLPTHRELVYHGSLWLKHVSGSAAVTVSLRRHEHADQTLATATLNATAETWTKFPFDFTLQRDQLAPLEPADLVISVNGDARVLVDNVSLDPADAIDGMDPDEIAMARDLHSPVIRFGGNFTSDYNWQDGLGPRDKRVSKLNLAWGIPEYNTFGTDEFLEFCKLIGAEPQIALNLGTGTPDQAAAWVRYVDEHFGDHGGGLLWELGNELWGNWQVGYPAQSEVAARTLATSEAVRKVDPRSRLIATGADEDTFHDWNAQQLTNPAGSFNYLSTHFVVGDQVELPHASDDFRSMASLALPWGLATQMRAIKQQAVAAGRPDVNVAFTEWLMISRGRTGPSFTNMGGALFASGFLNMVMRNADIVPISDMTGIMEFGGIWKKREQVYGAPAYWVLREYASERPHTRLDVQSDSPTYSIAKGVTRLPEIPNVPYLDVVAAESEDHAKLLLFCLNRNLDRPERAELDLSALGIGGGPAKVMTLSSDSITAENSDEEPDRIVPVAQTQKAGQKLAYTFPNASVTVIEIPLKH